MSEWLEYKISDIATLVKNSWKVGDEKLPYLGLEHIEEAKLRLNGVGSSDDVASNKYRFNVGDVLFGKLRPYFRKVVKPDFNGICSTDIWVINATEESDIDFIFYFFANQELIDLSYSTSSGTRMPRADWKFLSQTLWKIPPLKKQKAIAEVLSSLDDKIDLLHRQNKTLEELAQTLFRQWFIEEAKDEWEEILITDLFEVRDGTHDSPKQKEIGKPLITTKHMSNNKLDIENAYLISKEDFEKVNKRSVVEQHDILFSMIGTIGLVFLEESEKIDYAIKNIGLFKTSQNQDYKYYLYLWLKSSYGIEFIHENRSGSTQEYISLTSLRNIIFYIPNKQTILDFNEKVNPLFKKIFRNQQQIKTLENMRDTLLPKLMSEDVRVKIQNLEQKS